MKRSYWIATALIAITFLASGWLVLHRPVVVTRPLATTPAIPATPVPTPTPAQSVSFAPVPAKQDGKVTLTAAGFAPGEQVRFQTIGQPTGAGAAAGPTPAKNALLTLAETHANQRGVATADKVTVPDQVTSGPHPINAVGLSSGLRANSTLYVQAKSPWMTLGSYSVKPGGDVGLIFGGISPQSQAALSIEPSPQLANGGSQDVTQLSPPTSLLHVSTDRVGNAAWTDVRIPLLKPGTYTLVAAAGAKATANFVVLPLTPSIELSPWSGPPGSAVTMNARGFASSEQVQVFVGQATQPTLTVAADKYGNFWAAGPIHVPYGINAGALSIRFVGLASSAAVTQTFNVQSTKPWLELTAYSGPPGSPVGFSGGGWAAGERITFHQDSASGPEVGAGQADDYGWLRLSTTTSVPGGTSPDASSKSTVTYVAVGEQSHATASATFTVVNPFANIPPPQPPPQLPSNSP